MLNADSERRADAEDATLQVAGEEIEQLCVRVCEWVVHLIRSIFRSNIARLW
jgi:hypothetical protein